MRTRSGIGNAHALDSLSREASEAPLTRWPEPVLGGERFRSTRQVIYVLGYFLGDDFNNPLDNL